MVDFAFGFACGVLTVSTIFLVFGRINKTTVIIKDGEASYKVIEQENRVIKPDNEKARYFSTNEYKAERAYVEGLRPK